VFSLSGVRLRYICGVLCFIDGYLHYRYYNMCSLPRADFIVFYKYNYNGNAGDAIILFYMRFFLSPIVAHRCGAAHTHIGIILLRYRSELSPSSGGSWSSWLFDAEEFPFPNPLHTPTTVFPPLRVDLLARVFFPSKSLYFFFTSPWLNDIIFASVIYPA